MSVMASSGQQIDIAASVRGAYQVAIENARLAVNLALVPFAIVVGAEFLAWLVGGGGWFSMVLAILIQVGGFAVFERMSSFEQFQTSTGDSVRVGFFDLWDYTIETSVEDCFCVDEVEFGDCGCCHLDPRQLSSQLIT